MLIVYGQGEYGKNIKILIIGGRVIDFINDNPQNIKNVRDIV